MKKALLHIALCMVFSLSLQAAFNTSYVPSLVPAFSSPQEEKLVRELASKKLHSFSFLDAALIASGAQQNGLAAYKQKYQNMLEKIRRDLPLLGLDDMGKAAKIYELMFKHSMSAYKSEETTLLEILNDGSFNCVSASLLYNLIAGEFGYETRIVVVPGHVYSQVRVGKDWIDAETTSSSGFNPLRTRETTIPGRIFIDDRSGGGTKVLIPTDRLIALLYYNRGTLAHNQKNYEASVALLVRALYIFPEHFESQENLMASMIEWARRESDAGRSDLALSICAEAEQAFGQQKDILQMRDAIVLISADTAAKNGDFAGAVSIMEEYIKSHRNKNPNHETVLRDYLLKWAQQSQQQKRYGAMLELIGRASSGGRDAQAASMSLYLVTEAAKQITQSEGFAKGYAFFDKQFPKKNESAAVQQNRLYLYGLQINSSVEAKQYEEAYTLNRALMEIYPQNLDVRKYTAWIVQRWANDIASNSKEGEYLPKMIQLYNKLREPAIAEEMVGRTLRESNQLQQNKNFAHAEDNLKKLRDLRLGEPHAKFVDDMYRLVLYNWCVHHANRSEFLEAIEVGKRARALFPGDAGIENNLVKFYYSAGLDLLNKHNFDRAAKVCEEGLKAFPKNADLLKLRQNIPDAS